ncbi:MAG: hypothetical protein O7D30_00445, partial [Rickettsia endosymbiont of Ixodes persulcatus]|nr:hypothetical protein [Rickettsia endosymbiont of Ixodes persulcatus]
TYPSTVSGHKTRETAASFKDHFSQARLFWNSMSHVEKIHMMQAFSFELGKVKSKSVRQQVVGMIGHISTELAAVSLVLCPETVEGYVTVKTHNIL